MILLYIEVSSIMNEDLNVHFNREIHQIHFTLQKHFTRDSLVFALFRYEYESCRSFHFRTLNYVSSLLTSYFIKDTLLI